MAFNYTHAQVRTYWTLGVLISSTRRHPQLVSASSAKLGDDLSYVLETWQFNSKILSTIRVCDSHVAMLQMVSMQEGRTGAETGALKRR